MNPDSKHTTNYFNTLVEIAPDCPVDVAEEPKDSETQKSTARKQFEWIKRHPYQYTSDDVIFMAFAEKNDVSQHEMNTKRELFFSKGQPCLRASALTKRYGWGIHYNQEGKIALVPVESPEYKKLLEDPATTKYKAMRSSKK